MKQARIFMKDNFAGTLTEDENGYTFVYDPSFLANESAEAISLTLPLGEARYISTMLHPFLDGLICGGWLLEKKKKNWKISGRDRMSLLLACCKDCIGAVSVQPV